MSLHIIKAGILDTIQDMGRYGYQHSGINPDGAMDRFSARLANALLGKELHAPVLEMHFPASQMRFQKETIICLTGADFAPLINDQPVPLHHPIAVNKNTVLKFQKIVTGARCYVAFLPGLRIEPWMNSCSTNIKAGAGGWQGRSLQKGDQLIYISKINLSNLLGSKDFAVLPWKANDIERPPMIIEFIIGNEWMWLTREAQENFQEQLFQVTNEADRMGYRLAGKELEVRVQQQLISSAVSFGTVQLLPNGQLIILMADHQTTGGYPRVAYVISAHLPLLAQKGPNDVIQFRLTELAKAEQKIIAQQKYLQQLQNACKFRMENLIHAL